MTRVEIDLNARIGRGETYVGFEDADGPLVVGQTVEAYQPEVPCSGPAVVSYVSEEHRIARLRIDWTALRVTA